MGKRSRKRTGPRGPVARSPAAASPKAPAYTPPRDRRALISEAPPAPWAPVPLTEVGILAGMVLITVGFLRGGDRSGTLLVVGFALISLAGLELAVREHRKGYRSHSVLLGAATAIIVDAPIYLLTSAPYELLLILGVAIFAAAIGGLRRLFAQASGGLGFRA